MVETWQDISQDNYTSACELIKIKQYRSAVSRFYYAAFSTLTYNLSEAGVKFGNDQETPTHRGLPRLIKLHLPSSHRQDCITIIRRLYSARIAADYQHRTTDEAVARDARRDTALLLRYLEGKSG